MEAVWHGVPQVALPVYGDQLDVAHMLVSKGVALRVHKHFTAQQMHQAMEAVLNNTRYSVRLKKKQF